MGGEKHGKDFRRDLVCDLGREGKEGEEKALGGLIGLIDGGQLAFQIWADQIIGQAGT
jgi:hypothetical protein